MRRTPNKKPKVKAEHADHFSDPTALSWYLSRALETGNTTAMIQAIGNAIKAEGVTRISGITGLDRTNLYRSFSGTISPNLNTVIAVLQALEVRFAVQPIREPRKRLSRQSESRTS